MMHNTNCIHMQNTNCLIKCANVALILTEGAVVIKYLSTIVYNSLYLITVSGMNNNACVRMLWDTSLLYCDKQDELYVYCIPIT